MIVIPVESSDHARDALIVILDQTNLDRLKMNDPVEVLLRQCGKTLVNPSILICFEQPSKELSALIQQAGAKHEDALRKLVLICFEQPSKELSALIQQAGAKHEDALRKLVLICFEQPSKELSAAPFNEARRASLRRTPCGSWS